jgi:hypothetical protein
MRSRRIVSWCVAIFAGVVAEIGVFAVMPVALHFGPTGPFYAIPPAAFVMTFLAGLFAASVARSRLMAHGAVVDLTPSSLGKWVPDRGSRSRHDRGSPRGMKIWYSAAAGR